MEGLKQGTVGLFHGEAGARAALRVLTLAVALLGVVAAAGESRASYSATVLADHPAAYWRLGESTGNVALDSSGNGRHATYLGPILGQSGALVGDGDSAVLFNGYENDAIQRADSSGLVPGPDSWAVEAWVKVPWSGRAMEIVSWYAGGYQNGHDSYYSLRVSDRGEAGYYLRDTRGNWVDVVAPASIADDAWHHLVGLIDRAGAKARLYVDGAEVASAPLGSLGLISDFGIPVSLGFQYRFWTSDYGPLEGRLDEVALYRGALSEERVRLHYQVGRGLITDSDGDGVFDAVDSCPGTPPGAAVDASGCQPARCSAEQMDLMTSGALAAKDAVIAEKEALLAQKDALLAQKDATIASLNADVNALLGTLASKDELIAALNARIASMYSQAQLEQAALEAGAAARQSVMREISTNLAVSFGIPGVSIPGETVERQIANLSGAINTLPKGQIDKLKEALVR